MENKTRYYRLDQIAVLNGNAGDLEDWQPDLLALGHQRRRSIPPDRSHRAPPPVRMENIVDLCGGKTDESDFLASGHQAQRGQSLDG